MNVAFMKIALEEAYQGCRNNDGGPFGCCIVKENKVIARAHNTVLKEKNPTAHAEINAIRQAADILQDYKLKNCTIYTTTEPCPMCFSAIHWAGIEMVVYGTEIKEVKRLGFNELTISAETLKRLGHLDIEITPHFMHEECKKLLYFWETLPQREVY